MKLTKAERKKVASAMMARGVWWDSGDPRTEPRLDPRVYGLMWLVFREIYQPWSPVYDWCEWSMFWLILAEGVRIGALP